MSFHGQICRDILLSRECLVVMFLSCVGWWWCVSQNWVGGGVQVKFGISLPKGRWMVGVWFFWLVVCFLESVYGGVRQTVVYGGHVSKKNGWWWNVG